MALPEEHKACLEEITMALLENLNLDDGFLTHLKVLKVLGGAGVGNIDNQHSPSARNEKLLWYLERSDHFMLPNLYEALKRSNQSGLQQRLEEAAGKHGVSLELKGPPSSSPIHAEASTSREYPPHTQTSQGTAYRQGQANPPSEDGVSIKRQRLDYPSAPMRLKIIPYADKDYHTLSWEDPEDSGSSPVTGYIIESKQEDQADWKVIANVDAKMTKYEHKHDASTEEERLAQLYRVAATTSEGKKGDYAYGKKCSD